MITVFSQPFNSGYGARPCGFRSTRITGMATVPCANPRARQTGKAETGGPTTWSRSGSVSQVGNVTVLHSKPCGNPDFAVRNEDGTRPHPGMAAVSASHGAINGKSREQTHKRAACRPYPERSRSRQRTPIRAWISTQGCPEVDDVRESVRERHRSFPPVLIRSVPGRWRACGMRRGKRTRLLVVSIE